MWIWTNRRTKKQHNIFFIHKELTEKVIIDFKVRSAYQFKAKLGFKQYDVILTKKQSVLTKIMSSFEVENMQTHYV